MARSDGLRHGAYLTTGRVEDGRLMAVCSDGSPQWGHAHVTVLSVECVASEAEARVWFDRIMLERPWETRQ